MHSGHPRAPSNPRHEPRPRPNGDWALGYVSGRGHYVVDPRGEKVTGFIASQGEAEDRRDALRKAADARAKKGKRPCMCCGRAFDSDGIHNRLCQSCKGRGYATWETA